jgi:Holliday junction resolvase RusA-like endonuclease
MKLTIWGTLPGLNDIIREDRRNRHAGAKLKKEAEYAVTLCAKKSLKRWRPAGPVFMHYVWYEPNKRRDKDNVAAGGRKIVQDALVKAGYLKGDGWRDIAGFSDEFRVDKNEPRIEVEIEEVNHE